MGGAWQGTPGGAHAFAFSTDGADADGRRAAGAGAEPGGRSLDHDAARAARQRVRRRHDAAVRHGKILVQASIYQYEGQLFVYHPKGDGPCLRCLWPEEPDPGCVGSCAEAGVLGALHRRPEKETAAASLRPAPER